MIKYSSFLLLCLLTACAGVPAPESEHRQDACDRVGVRWTPAWRSFTNRVEALSPLQRVDVYAAVLARHVESPSDLTRLQLAYLQVRMDSTDPSLHYARSLL